MRTDSKLRKALLKKLGGVTQQRLSQLVKTTKERHGPMSTADASYVIAHQKGLDLTKYLDGATVDRVRSLIPGGSAPASGVTHSRNSRNSKNRKQASTSTIAIPGVTSKVDALLSTTLAQDAKEMAELYALYYILENSMRVVIKRVLEGAHDKDWWATRAPNEVRKTVTERQEKESRTPWHGKRNAHEIYYSDFGDLRRIIEKNWKDFEAIFPTRSWITQKLDELEHPRNVMAHHNPTSESDRNRVRLYFDDWIQLLKSKKEVIP